MKCSRNFCIVQKLVYFIWQTFLFFEKKIENITLLILRARLHETQSEFEPV